MKFKMDPMEAKIAGMICLGIGTMIVGLLPAWFSSHSQRWPLLLSSLLCFGGGVLLSTSMIHILPELRAITDKAELFLCIGFFVLYFIDEIVHYFWSDNHDHRPTQQHIHSHNHSHNHSHHEERINIHGHKRSYSLSLSKNNGNYDTTETTPLVCGSENNLYYQQRAFNPSVDAVCSHNSVSDDNRPTQSCHVSHTEPCNNPPISQMGLLLALSLHSILEGLAIGLENSVSKVWLLVGAVASHKLVVGFCLGAELSSGPTTTACKHFMSITLFALGSVGGIATGMFVTGISDNKWSTAVTPVLQGLAAGTLLYVTVCEVLPRERARWHNQTTCPAASLMQFIAVVAGFALTTLLTVFLDFD